MKIKLLAVILMIAAAAPSCNLIRGKKLQDAQFVAKGVSVSTVSVGETTSVYGVGFGDVRGKVYIGEAEATVVSWNDKVVRIRIPKLPEERYDVNVEPPDSKKKFAQKIAVRGPVNEGLYDWLEGKITDVDSSAMEPLVLVFKPVGPPTSGIFDFDAPMPKGKMELVEEIEWACRQGVQMVQLYFPAQTSPDAERYADVSIVNIRDIVDQVSKRCPGMLIDIDTTFMPDGNIRLARFLPTITNETIYNLGSFEPAPDKDLRLEGITDPDAAQMEIAETLSYYKHPIPYVMTTWQAFDIKKFAQNGVSLPEPRSAILSLALDQRALDGKKAYNDIKNLLPAGTRTIAATNLLHASEIMGYSIAQGDHLAFGFHYSSYWPGSSKTYIPNNMFFIEKTLQVAEKIKRPLASLNEAAEMIGVVPIPATSIAPLRVKNIMNERPRNTYIKSKRGRGRLSVLDGIPSNTVLDVADSFDGQELWVITDKGLYVTEDRGTTFEKVSIKSRNSFQATAIAATANGSIWVASPGYGILRTADYGRKWDTYNVDSGSLSGDYAASLYSYGDEIYSCIYKAEKGQAPAGAGIGYTTDNGKIWNVWSSRDELPFNDCRTVYVEDGAVFVGFGGLDAQSQAMGLGISADFGKTWTLVPGIEAPVLSIAMWHDNTLVVGTKGAGAFNVKYNGAKADRISEVPETATVSDIVIDGRGWIWLVTDSGVLVSDSKSGPFRTFTPVDGLGSSKVTGGAYAGEVFFSTAPDSEFDGGLSEFYLEK